VEKALRNFPVEDIWGIGRQSAKKLAQNNIHTAIHLRDANEKMIQKLLTIQGLRIVKELNGEACLSLQLIESEKKQIVSSRSFGRSVVKIEELRESIANHISLAAEKLRRQNSLTKSITVFLQTNPFKAGPQYYNSGYVNLMSGTSVTNKMIHHAFNVLEQIYQAGFEYKKCGVMLADLYPKALSQIDMFGFTDSIKEDERMKIIDEINRFHGRGSIKHAACGIDQFWQMLSQMKSPCYTTRWSELKEVK
jgi:DNA polymerase V